MGSILLGGPKFSLNLNTYTKTHPFMSNVIYFQVIDALFDDLTQCLWVTPIKQTMLKFSEKEKDLQQSIDKLQTPLPTQDKSTTVKSAAANKQVYA